jgi:hypothetical protein
MTATRAEEFRASLAGRPDAECVELMLAAVDAICDHAGIDGVRRAKMRRLLLDADRATAMVLVEQMALAVAD